MESAEVRLIGDRLREERARLKLNQTELGSAVGAAKRTVVDWEKGRTAPSSAQMAALSGMGCDVLYILTGRRQPAAALREDAHIRQEAAIREQEGFPQYAELMSDVMKRKTEHYARRLKRLDPIVDRLSMCSDADFELIEAMLARFFDNGERAAR